MIGLTLVYTGEKVEAEIKVALAQLLCSAKHGRLAACNDCQASAVILAKPWAQTILVAACEGYEEWILSGRRKRQYKVDKHSPPVLTLDESVMAGRAVATLIKLSRGLDHGEGETSKRQGPSSGLKQGQ